MNNRAIGDRLENQVIAEARRKAKVEFRKSRGSGAVHQDGDAHSEDFTLECKQKETHSFSFPKAEVDKAVKDARTVSKRAIIARGNKDGAVLVGMELEDFLLLLGSHRRCGELDDLIQNYREVFEEPRRLECRNTDDNDSQNVWRVFLEKYKEID